MAGRTSLLMRPNRFIWVQEGNWKVRRQTRTWEKQEQCLCTAHRSVLQILKSCGTGQTGNTCLSPQAPHPWGQKGLIQLFQPRCHAGSWEHSSPLSFSPVWYQKWIHLPAPFHSCPTLLPVYPSKPINFPHTCPRRNGKDWKFHHFVVINIHNIFLGLIPTLCPKRNQNNLPKISWIIWEPGIESTRLHLLPAPCGTRRHWHHIHNYTFRGNKVQHGSCPNPCEHPGSPRLGNIPAPSIT